MMRKRKTPPSKAVQTARRMVSRLRTGGFGSYGGLRARNTRSGRPEFKYLDTSQANAVISNLTPGFSAGPPNLIGAPAVTVLNGASIGAFANNRIGRKICIHRLKCRFNFTPIGTYTTGRVGIVIVLDSQCNGQNPTPADILADLGQTTNQGNIVQFANGSIIPDLLPNNLSNTGRFRILFKRSSLLLPVGSIDSKVNVVFKKIMKFRKYGGIVTTYNAGNAGTQADIATNGIFAIAWSTGGLASPTLTWTCRITFTDSQ